MNLGLHVWFWIAVPRGLIYIPICAWTFVLIHLCYWRWRSQLMWRVFFTSAIVAVVVRTAMNWCKSGKCGHFGSGGFIIWDVSELGSKLSSVLYFTYMLTLSSCLNWFLFSGQEDYSFEELFPMAIIGVIGGLLGMYKLPCWILCFYGIHFLFFIFFWIFW